MAMRRKDFTKLYGMLVDAQNFLEKRQLSGVEQSLREACEFLETQQYTKPRGNPFSQGEDSRRKDRLVARDAAYSSREEGGE